MLNYYSFVSLWGWYRYTSISRTGWLPKKCPTYRESEVTECYFSRRAGSVARKSSGLSGSGLSRCTFSAVNSGGTYKNPMCLTEFDTEYATAVTQKPFSTFLHEYVAWTCAFAWIHIRSLIDGDASRRGLGRCHSKCRNVPWTFVIVYEQNRIRNVTDSKPTRRHLRPHRHVFYPLDSYTIVHWRAYRFSTQA